MEAVAAKIRWCVLLPAFREEGRIGATVRGVRAQCPAVVVVNDGSPDGTSAEARAAGAEVIDHPRNMGKGAALNTGLRHAADAGYDVVITMDADGQHDPSDIPGFLERRESTGADVVVGNRMADPRTMPLVRRLTNRFMSWLLSRRMGQRVPDTQNGFRLYARRALPLALSRSGGFAAESEALLRMADAGLRIASTPVRIIYGDEKSKIRPVRDTVRFFRMLRAYDRSRGKPT